MTKGIPRALIAVSVLVMTSNTWGQVVNEMAHRRGRLWENVVNDGWIGSLGAWDFLVSLPLGLFPGFEGFVHPVGGESNAVDTYANANMHNFRSGVWIVAKDMMVPGSPPGYTPEPVKYEGFFSGWQADAYGVVDWSERIPMELLYNYIEDDGFDPLLPEEMFTARWHTNTGITVTRRSYVWSYPGYRDFILYDYSFKNSGKIVSVLTGEVLSDFPEQMLNNVYFAFHSAISVSTKSQINFHSTLDGVQAGAFGWKQETFHDYYHVYDGGELVFSTNYNGGKEPTPFDTWSTKDPSEWQAFFGDELQSPAAFGWIALYADPITGQPRTSSAPDVLRIDSHKGGLFQGRDLDLERFRIPERTKKEFYDFVSTPDLQEVLGNEGNRLNIYTLSYGPYALEPDDSVRIILAEIAGVMDYDEINAGDPEGHFPDSTIAAIRRNADCARRAVQWGMGATVDGVPMAADVPEPPPGPHANAVNASEGVEIPRIAVTWDNIAETAQFRDGSGSIFYEGANDLDGYRVYRSQDFQFTSENEPTVLRGADWDLLVDIPRHRFDDYWDTDLQLYRFVDESVAFGKRYGYYVSAYNSNPGTWVSVNGTEVNNLPELESGDYNRTPPASPQPGPVTSFDIFVTPNPYVFNDPDRSYGRIDPYKVEFRNLPESCDIRIYTISGDLVRILEHRPDAVGNLSGIEEWDQKSDSGLLVAPGLYIYHAGSTTAGLDKSSFVGKLMLIR